MPGPYHIDPSLQAIAQQWYPTKDKLVLSTPEEKAQALVLELKEKYSQTKPLRDGEITETDNLFKPFDETVRIQAPLNPQEHEGLTHFFDLDQLNFLFNHEQAKSKVMANFQDPDYNRTVTWEPK